MSVAAPGAGAAERRPWLRPVDFSKPSALPADQQARLRRMVDEFCVVLVARALTDLGLPVHVEALEIRESTWREAHGAAADEAITTSAEASAGGVLHFAVDPALALAIVERLLGGESDPSRPPRSMTQIDRALLSRFSGVVVDSFERVWADATQTTIELAETRAHRDIALDGGASAPTMLLTMQVQLEGRYAVLHVLLPQETLMAVGAQLSRPPARGTAENPVATAALQARLGQAAVQVDVLLGSARLSARHVAALAPGERVPLGVTPETPADLLVDGIVVQHGLVGRSGARRAVQIVGAGEGQR